jgi:hypothetical protein
MSDLQLDQEKQLKPIPWNATEKKPISYKINFKNAIPIAALSRIISI